MNTSTSGPAEPSHPLDEAERALGGRAALAKELEVTPGAIGNWKARGVPIKYCVRIEQLVPTVTRRELRPDDFREIWPELNQPHPLRRASDHPHPLRRATDVLPGAPVAAGEG